jgi:hypothetical protein
MPPGATTTMHHYKKTEVYDPSIEWVTFRKRATDMFFCDHTLAIKHIDGLLAVPIFVQQFTSAYG